MRIGLMVWVLVSLFASTLAGRVQTVDLGATQFANSTEYLERVKQDIRHCQEHPNATLSARLTHSPATAFIVGVGTVGVEAIVAATRVLPEGSTIVVMQRSLEHPGDLENVLRQEIKNGTLYRFIVSPSLDLGELDRIEGFMDSHGEILSKTRLYIHTADQARRYVPDELPVRDVLVQVLRRASVTVIGQKLEAMLDSDQPLAKILISSECSQNRDRYRVPNLAVYQVGKVVGDELFRSNSIGSKSLAVIAYSGPMSTEGQRRARASEYRVLKQHGVATGAKSAEDFVAMHINNPDVDPMDSVGMMLKQSLEAIAANSLQPGKCYAIYGPSVCPDLGKSTGELEELPEAPYMWDLLVGDRTIDRP